MDLSKMPLKQKIAFFFLLPVALLMLIIGFFSDNPDDNPSPPKTEQAAKDNKAKPNPKNKAKAKSSEETENKQEQTQSQTKANASNLRFLAEKLDIPTTNPFVEISNLVKAKKDADKGITAGATVALQNVPAISTRRSNPVPANVPLPVIPQNRTPQNQSSLSPKEAPKPLTVQGILTSEDGHNMAIMSDGKVVSEGDVYGDGRIAFIGGDGIKFDNGKTMQYK